MTHPPDELTEIQICRARGDLRQTVNALLQGSGLQIRELANALTVSNPRDPDKGRIHIAYVTGDVSLRRVTWDYFGLLEGYESGGDPDHEPGVGAAKIITALTEQAPPPAI
jgi:hypothetical protein